MGRLMAEEVARSELLTIAHDRLYPSLTNPSFLVLRKRRLIFSEWIRALPSEKLSILDVGGRYQPYRPLLAGRIEKYVAVDLKSTSFVDVVGHAQQLPFRDKCFDLVIATSVFEYFPEPGRAAAQIFRVLKPGGCLMMSVAAVCPRFGDDEYWRFLPAGLRSVLSSFPQVAIVPEVTSLGGFVRTTAFALHVFAKFALMRKIVDYTLVPALNLLGLAFETAGLTQNDQLTGNYSVVARK
jgi:SAM-dependent methyltransferase